MATPDSLHLLIIEDDSLMLATIKHMLKGHRLESYATLAEYFKNGDIPDDAHLKTRGTSKNNFDLILLDLCSPQDRAGEETLSLFPKLRQAHARSEIVVQSGLNEVTTMRRCLKLGAERFILKEHLPEELPLLIEQCLDKQNQKTLMDEMISGESPSMRALKKDLLLLRSSPHMDCLIEGETGTGKEVSALALKTHDTFIPVNVSAVSRELFEAEFFGAEKGAFTGSTGTRVGFFESAGEGILFLDEIQSLDLGLQSKLLRVLESRTFMRVGSTQSRPFKGRVVAASNEVLREKVARGEFREDLYFRLAQAKVSLPPLRARGGDIVMLAEQFLQEFDRSKKIKFTEKAKEWMNAEYDWPGNVRELKALIKRAIVQTKMPFLDREELQQLVEGDEKTMAIKISTQEVGQGFQPDATLGFDDNVKAFESHLLQFVLQTHSSQEARGILKLSRTRFYEKLRAYNLSTK